MKRYVIRSYDYNLIFVVGWGLFDAMLDIDASIQRICCSKKGFKAFLYRLSRIEVPALNVNLKSFRKLISINASPFKVFAEVLYVSSWLNFIPLEFGLIGRYKNALNPFYGTANSLNGSINVQHWRRTTLNLQQILNYNHSGSPFFVRYISFKKV